MFVAGFRTDYTLKLAECLQSREVLGVVLHRNRYNLNEVKKCKIICQRETPERPTGNSAITKDTTTTRPNDQETTAAADTATKERTTQQGNLHAAISTGTTASPSENTTTTDISTNSTTVDITATKEPAPEQDNEEKEEEEEEEEDNEDNEDNEDKEEDQPPIIATELLVSENGKECWSTISDFLTNCPWESSEEPACNNCNEQRTSILNVTNIVRATVRCGDCDEYFCRKCYDKIHSGGKRRSHVISWELEKL